MTSTEPDDRSEQRAASGLSDRWQTSAGHVRTADIVRAASRSLLSIVALFLVYAVLPLEHPLRGNGAGLLAIGLVLFAAVLTYEVRAILRAKTPGLRALEALAVIVPLFLLTFAGSYVVMSHNAGNSFTQPLDRVNAFYFTVTVFATVGFGDITPLTESARIAVTVQMLGDLIVLGVVLKLVVGAVRLSRQRGAPAAAPVDPARSEPDPAEHKPADQNKGGDRSAAAL